MSYLKEKSKNIVLKFGGTSVKDAAAMKRVVEITASESHYKKIVVTSACSGITDKLLAISMNCANSNQQEAQNIFDEIKQHHLQVLKEISRTNDAENDTKNNGVKNHDITDNIGADTEKKLLLVLNELENLITGAMLLGEITPRTKDYFASFGERLSSILLTQAFAAQNHKTLLFDSREVIITDDNFTNAKPLMPLIKQKATTKLLPVIEQYDVIVAQGFIGMSETGITTTIGRGGSDHTGALIGAAIGSEEIQIWTDVSGILTADPRAVPTAKVVPELTFSEARQLAYFGAKVLHPDTIVPAVEHDIPVVIKNSMKPEDPGTRILPDSASIQPGVHSITIKKDILIFKIKFNSHLSNVSKIFTEHNTDTECFISAENRCIVAIKTTEFSDELYTALEEKFEIEIINDAALLCLCGSELSQHHTTIASALNSIEGKIIYFIASGFSQYAVLMGIYQPEANEILSSIHATLFD